MSAQFLIGSRSFQVNFTLRRFQQTRHRKNTLKMKYWILWHGQNIQSGELGGRKGGQELVFELGTWKAAAEGVGRKNSVLPREAPSHPGHKELQIQLLRPKLSPHLWELPCLCSTSAPGWLGAAGVWLEAGHHFWYQEMQRNVSMGVHPLAHDRTGVDRSSMLRVLSHLLLQ